jgi:hypothetical protein
MKEDEADIETIRYGSVEFEYPRDEPDPESPSGDRDLEKAVKVAEWMARLIWAGRTDRVRMMHASVGIAILRNQLNIQEIARHFSVTQQRVAQVVKKVKSFEILEGPHY